jgi:hypothetical protein
LPSIAATQCALRDALGSAIFPGKRLPIADPDLLSFRKHSRRHRHVGRPGYSDASKDISGIFFRSAASNSLKKIGTPEGLAAAKAYDDKEAKDKN